MNVTRASDRRRRLPGRDGGLALAVAALVALAALTIVRATPAGAVSGTHYVARTSTWMSGAPLAFVQGWDKANHRVALIRKGAPAGAAIFQGHWAPENGSGTTCATCTVAKVHQMDGTTVAWAATDISQRGIADVFAGQHPGYAVVTAEKRTHPGTLGGASSEPGKGTYNDLYIMNPTGTEAWQVTNIPNAENNGIIWPRLNKDGTRIVWSQLYAGFNPFNPYKQLLGAWRLQLADITWVNGAPRLGTVKSFEPEAGNFYEAYGFSPDGTNILYASSAQTAGFHEAQIYRIPTTLAGAPVRLSDAATPSDFYAGTWTNYNEFAFYTPDGSHIIYGRIKDSAAGGLDYWIMDKDGGRQERLTYLNEPWNNGGYRNVGGWAIDPNSTDPSAPRVLFGACRDKDCESSDIFSMTLATNPAGSGTGLKGEYFSDKTLTTKVLARTDSTVGFRFTAKPDPSVPATNFSARWTGSVTPYAAGSHTFCVYADDGVRLWVDGTLVVNAWNDRTPAQLCSPALNLSLSAHTLKLEYYNAGGEGSAKLTWNVPNQGGVREVVPMGRLTPAA